MNRRSIAALTALALIFGAFTSCGDEMEESSSVSNLFPEASEETDKAAASTTVTSAGIETAPPTTELETEPTDEPSAPAVTPRTDPTDLIGRPVSEVATLIGEVSVEADGEIEGFYLFYSVSAPEITFHFEDHSWDGRINIHGSADADLDILSNIVSSSDEPVYKINRFAGRQDEFDIGESYTSCADVIGDFPLTGGTRGYTNAGAPSSMEYTYLHEKGNCVVQLHFDYLAQLEQEMYEKNGGKLGSYDFPAEEVRRYDPQLRVITVLYAPPVTLDMSSANFGCSSKLIGSDGYSYGPEKAFDGDLSTCWCEGSEGGGTGEYISVKSPGIPENCYITVYGGLLASEKDFCRNCRPAVVEIGTNNSAGSEYYLPTDYSVKYKRAIPMLWTTDNYVIRIIESEADEALFSDTCISEIVFNGSYR